MDPLELIAQLRDQTRPAAVRAAAATALKDLLVALPADNPTGLQAALALWQVFQDPTEPADVHQAVTQTLKGLPGWWREAIEQHLGTVLVNLFVEMQLQDSLALLQQGMTVARFNRVMGFWYERDARLLAALAAATDHPDPAIRAAALGYQACYGEMGLVVHALRTDAAASVRAAAAEALSYAPTRELQPEDFQAVEEALAEALADPDPAVRGAAQVTLRRLGRHPLPPPPSAPPVVPALAAAPTPEATRYPWAPFLVQWSWRLLQDDEVRADLPDDVCASGWLGYPGATEAQLVTAEARLGRRLPPSYRAFLQVTNGWRGPEQYRFLPIEEVDLYLTKDPDQAEGLAEMVLDAAGADLSEAAHRVYGAGQDPGQFRGAYVRTALQISEPAYNFGYEVMLLNPEVVTPEGEWEAWLVGTKLPGVARRPSFRDMLHEMVVTNFPEHPPDETASSGDGPEMASDMSAPPPA